MSDEAIDIGVCRREDLPEIRRILEGAPGAALWSEEALEEAMKEAPDEFLVARMGSEIAGFIMGRQIGMEAEILDLAVREGSRRAGVGTALVKELLARYDAEGRGKTFLEVRETNQGAIAFYERLGFRRVGRRAGYYRDPVEAALVLARDG